MLSNIFEANAIPRVLGYISASWGGIWRDLAGFAVLVPLRFQVGSTLRPRRILSGRSLIVSPISVF
jgi:hypothetical protein